MKKNKEGSITLSTIILFMAFIIGLLAILAGVRYVESLRKATSSTQFAAEGIFTNVVSYNSELNIAEFEDSSIIKNNALSIIKGNLGIGQNDDLTNTFVSEIPTIEIIKYDEIEEKGIDVSFKGKSFHLDKPGVLIAVKYKYKPILLKSIGAPEITVVRKYEINNIDNINIDIKE